MKFTMFDHVLVLMAAVAVVVATQEGGVTIHSTIPAVEAETSPEGVTHLEVEEEKEEKERHETSNEVMKMIEQNERHDSNDDEEMTITEESERQEPGDRMINMIGRSEGNDTNDEETDNMIMGRPEVVTVLPDVHKWRKMDNSAARKGKRRPHNARRNRKHKGRRRKWKNRQAKKFYRRNRTYEWGAKKYRKSGDMQAGHWQYASPNQRDAWTAGQSFRSLDPRRMKVKRYLVRQHNLLRSKVNPPAGDMLAMKWYKTAAEQAQAWAEQCGRHSNADHPSVRWTSSYGACGQNVFVSPTKKRWNHVLQHWWGARKEFRYGEINNLTAVAAYTQMAWYNSHQLGCGFSQCNNPGGSTFFRYVCNYCPVGNDPERLGRPYTEGAPCSLCPGACRPLCSRHRCPLCTNACTYSDMWVNCGTLDQQWHEWLCNTKTKQGVERFKNCRATCQCVNEIT